MKVFHVDFFYAVHPLLGTKSADNVEIFWFWNIFPATGQNFSLLLEIYMFEI